MTGSNLDRIYHRLCLSRQRLIRIGANEDDDGDLVVRATEHGMTPVVELQDAE